MSARFRVNTLRARIVLGLGALLAGMGLIAAIGIWGVRTVGGRITGELRALRDVAEISGGLVSTVFDELRAAEQYLSQPSDAARAIFVNTGKRAYDYQRRLRAVPGISEQDRVNINQMGELQARVEVGFSLAHALADLGRRDQSLAAVAEARQPAAELVDIVREFSRLQAQHADATVKGVLTAAGERERIVWLVLAISVIGGLIIGVTTVSMVDRPLGRLVEAARRFGDGDLRPAEFGAMPDELNELAGAMGHLGTRLRSLVASVTSESDSIATTAGDLSAVSQELAATAGQVTTAMMEISSGAERQVAGLEQGAAGAERLGVAAESNARVAGRVARLGEEIHQVAARYQTDITAAGVALLDLQEVVRTSAAQVERLDRLSDAVDDFVSLIKRISSQTNLLALNAAIEAARAGERGMGFAVVAEEVRQLADSSAKAAEEVTETIKTVRQQIAEVSATMASGRSKAGGIEAIAHGAGHALEEIVRSIQEVEDAARQVAREAAANLTAATEIKRVVREVAEAAQTHASSSEQVTAAAEEQSASTQEMAAQAGSLTEAAERLRGLVQSFKV